MTSASSALAKMDVIGSATESDFSTSNTFYNFLIERFKFDYTNIIHKIYFKYAFQS